jgi:hypothetical protein
METKFNFNSQVCTSRSQSEKLLALGLKKETADMRGVEGIEHTPTYAWSLHRLIELAYGNWKEDIVPIYLGNSYDMLIGRIEFQVKQGKFNKEYLEE